MISFSSSRHLLMRARRLRSSSGFVIFLYWWVRDRGTSESELGEEMDIRMLLLLWPPPPALGNSGEDSSSEEDGDDVVVCSMVVDKVTLGEKAEKGFCQFMTADQMVTDKNNGPNSQLS